MSKDLKPCPFCGGEAKMGKDYGTVYHESVRGNMKRRYVAQVVCPSCGMSGRSSWEASEEQALEKAITDWNRRANGWIPCGERMPKAWKGVLIFPIDGAVDIGIFDGGGKFIVLDQYTTSGNVTHWTPLPEPPDTQEGADQ